MDVFPSFSLALHCTYIEQFSRAVRPSNNISPDLIVISQVETISQIFLLIKKQRKITIKFFSLSNNNAEQGLFFRFQLRTTSFISEIENKKRLRSIE